MNNFITVKTSVVKGKIIATFLILGPQCVYTTYLAEDAQTHLAITNKIEVSADKGTSSWESAMFNHYSLESLARGQ